MGSDKIYAAGNGGINAEVVVWAIDNSIAHKHYYNIDRVYFGGGLYRITSEGGLHMYCYPSHSYRIDVKGERV